MGAEARLVELGITLPGKTPKLYLNLAVKVGNIVYTSGHTSDMKGKLGADLTVDQGKAAAREAILKVLNSVRNVTGTLDHLRVVRLLGCVNSTLEFTDQHLVMNGGFRSRSRHLRQGRLRIPRPLGCRVCSIADRRGGGDRGHLRGRYVTE